VYFFYFCLCLLEAIIFKTKTIIVFIRTLEHGMEHVYQIIDLELMNMFHWLQALQEVFVAIILTGTKYTKMAAVFFLVFLYLFFYLS
jgi:hypothetical protein